MNSRPATSKVSPRQRQQPGPVGPIEIDRPSLYLIITARRARPWEAQPFKSVHYRSKDQDPSLGGRRRVDCAAAESTQDDWDRSWQARRSRHPWGQPFLIWIRSRIMPGGGPCRSAVHTAAPNWPLRWLAKPKTWRHPTIILSLNYYPNNVGRGDLRGARWRAPKNHNKTQWLGAQSSEWQGSFLISTMRVASL